MGRTLTEIPAEVIPATIIVVALVALCFSLWNLMRSRRRGLLDVCCVNAKENEVDVAVLKLLLSREENEYLCKSLPDRAFREIKRQRLSIARKYLSAISRSTRQLIRVAEAAKSSSDADVARVAHEVLAIAFRVRLNLPIVQLYLMAEWLLPTLSLVGPRKVNLYEEIFGRAGFILRRLQAAQSGTSSAA